MQQDRNAGLKINVDLTELDSFTLICEGHYVCMVPDCNDQANDSGYCNECEVVQGELKRVHEKSKELIIEDGDLSE